MMMIMMMIMMMQEEKVFKNITPIYTGETNEADNPTDNIMCQDILINVILGCENEPWRLQFGVN